jgi:hypothetical protein
MRFILSPVANFLQNERGNVFRALRLCCLAAKERDHAAKHECLRSAYSLREPAKTFYCDNDHRVSDMLALAAFEMRIGPARAAPNLEPCRPVGV